MQVVRTLKKVQGQQIIIDLPDNFHAQEVEVIVIPYEELSVYQPNTTVVQDKLLGLFADETKLIDEVVESAMQSRTDDPLRYVDG